MVPVNQVDHLFDVLLCVRVMYDYLESIEPHEGRLLESFYDLHILTVT